VLIILLCGKKLLTKRDIYQSIMDHFDSNYNPEPISYTLAVTTIKLSLLIKKVGFSLRKAFYGKWITILSVLIVSLVLPALSLAVNLKIKVSFSTVLSLRKP
jgi:hypothetical protein